MRVAMGHGRGQQDRESLSPGSRVAAERRSERAARWKKAVSFHVTPIWESPAGPGSGQPAAWGAGGAHGEGVLCTHLPSLTWGFTESLCEHK